MKLGEIKIEALKLMFASYERDFSVSDLNADVASDTYRDYLINMPGAINRAFAIIENKGVLPVKRYEIKDTKVTKVDMSVVEDFFSVERVIFEGAHGEYVPQYPYLLEGTVIRFPDTLADGEKYTVLYRPSIKRVTDNAEDVDVPDNIAVYIPYFIKGELYREEQPGEASEAHNLFMKALDELIPEKAGGGSVTTVFGIRW